MQEAILRLTSFWTDQGCCLGQPFNTEVGAGTLNPATFLRVLGPEPWRTVYVEPSVRPDDSRYGENPNRMQTHTQLQVILKPDPGDGQELYLRSLAAIGIDTRVHDVRFVEDNWESPALGAWGLGWEVWLDGLEITQFTYFQQAGGLSLEPISVEITYGVERILMALQGATHFKDIRYSSDLSYGELVGQAELEMSTYYLDDADIEANRALFEIYEAEAQRLIERRLPVPAHQYVLKCSHTFNVLDSRGAVGTTERARAFRRMRKLAHDIAELWVERRAELGHPLGVVGPRRPPATHADGSFPGEPSTLVIELGFEELPPDQVTSYVEQFAHLLETALAERRIGHGRVAAYGSPRRIIAEITDVEPRQPDRVVRTRGPRANVAFQEDGTPTTAGEGFARKHGVDPAALEREIDGDIEYVVVNKTEAGRLAGEVLAEALPELIEAIAPRRGMRWSAGPAFTASRALRWIVALLGDAVVPFSYADVTSGRETRVLRDATRPTVSVSSADELLATLRANDVEFDGDERSRRIRSSAEDLAASVSGWIDLVVDGDVLDEVTNLVENPQLLLGSFEEEFLRLPPEVLTVVMKEHQRYFPVRDVDGRLLPRFVAAANGPVEPDAVRAGNEAVLRARYADAAFFFDRDREQPLEAFREGLAALTFEERVGSMLERSIRITRLTGVVGAELGLDGEQLSTLERAAYLAKADLATSLVIELPSLAGEMGRTYARSSGETDSVAEAIFEGVLPRFAGDRLPASIPGAVLSVADRADALVSLFAVGAKPTGSNDPYALRRAATGLVQVMTHHELPVDLDRLFRAAAGELDLPVEEKVLEELHEFVATRFEVRLVDEGHQIGMVRAVAPRFTRPTEALVTLRQLEQIAGQDRFDQVAAAYRRTARISRQVEAGDVDEALLTEGPEADLWAAFAQTEDDLRAASLPGFVDRFTGLVEPIDTFFDKVMVMAEEKSVRSNRLRLVARIRDSGVHLLNWEEIPDRVPAAIIAAPGTAGGRADR